METKTSFGKIVTTYGLISGIALFVLGLLYYLFDVDFFNFLFIGVSMVVSFGIVIVFAVFGTRAYRENILGGQISYGKKFISVLLISLIALILSSILNYVFYELVDPEYVARQADDFLLAMEERGLSEEQLSGIEEGFKDGFSPLHQLIQGLKFMPGVAAVLSLIVAATIKSDTTLPN